MSTVTDRSALASRELGMRSDRGQQSLREARGLERSMGPSSDPESTTYLLRKAESRAGVYGP